MRNKIKYFFVAILILSINPATAQYFTFDSDVECGTWVANPTYYTDWQSIDTLLSKPIKDTARNWVYNEEKMVISSIATLQFCPCGCGDDTRWEQYRVCKITGIRQVRFKIQSYDYKPKPKTEYKMAIDSILSSFPHP